MTNNEERDTEADVQSDEELSELKDLRIIRLEIENVKRIKAAIIEPDEPVIVIGGRNGSGKSSAIDSIAYALGGKALCPDEPLRRGAKRGFAKVDLGEYTVKRIFTPGGSRLEVKTAKGFTPPGGPQELLDKIIGKMQLEFDPVAFLHKKRPEQLEIIKRLAGIDCSDLDEKRGNAYDKRTDVNRDVKKLKAQLDSMPLHEDAPDEEESASFLLGELDRRREVNEQNDAQRRQLEAMLQTSDDLRNEIDSLSREINDLQRRMDERKNQLQKLQDSYTTQREITESIVDENLDEIRQRIDAAEELNRRVRENAARVVVEDELEAAQELSTALTGAIDECDAERKERIASANLPVEGLGFNEDCVTFDDLPLDQASQAKQTRVVVAIAFALSGKLKIALVRSGSLLDDDSLAQIRHEVKVARGELWLEHVRAGDEATVVFEDGKVAG